MVRDFECSSSLYDVTAQDELMGLQVECERRGARVAALEAQLLETAAVSREGIDWQQRKAEQRDAAA